MSADEREAWSGAIETEDAGAPACGDLAPELAATLSVGAAAVDVADRAPTADPADPVLAERARIKAIREAFPGHPAFADAQVDAGASVVEARAAFADVALAQLAEREKAAEVALDAERARRAEAEEKLAEAQKLLARGW